MGIKESGSLAKGTAVSLASDVDYLISLKSGCDERNGGLEYTYNGLYQHLAQKYTSARKQNVSVGITLDGLKIDITPARKMPGNTNDHALFVSKAGTWTKTNIDRHIADVSGSGRCEEIRLLKIWRAINGLKIPSIYLEYLTIGTILNGKKKAPDALADNFWHALGELSKDAGNPINARIVDPANSNNILSELANKSEKAAIVAAAKASRGKGNWQDIVA